LELVDLLGFRLDPDKTDKPHYRMDILGASILLTHSPDRLLIRTSIDQAKASFWIKELSSLTDLPSTSSRIFERLAGKLAFACFSAFGRSARSKLNYIYQAAYNLERTDLSQLRSELDWWGSHLPCGLKIEKIRS
jgi:hypothetical protein